MKLTTATLPTIDQGAIDAIVGAYHGDPFAVLGMHEVGDHLVVRLFRPDARALSVIDSANPTRVYPGISVSGDGFFEAVIEGREDRFAYSVQFTAHNGHVWTDCDPYSFPILFGELDGHLFMEGQHWELYRHLGAHVREIQGVRGTSFHVWAPNAQRVSVVGEFNGWDGRVHPMRKLLGCGVWEIFLPGIAEGAHYKFEVRGCFGQTVLKSDPFAFFSQHGVETASLVYALDHYQWSDEAWMKQRAETNWQKKPISIYECHLGSWRRKAEEGNRFLSYRELADELVEYVHYLGYTHIELMPVAEHPFEGSWGYQVTGYFAPTSRFGTPDEFRYFVDRAHQRGLGIILDWVPGHFPKDVHGLAEFDGTDLYEHADPRKGEHMDWGTLIFNYGRNEVRNFLIANALFWLEEYHIDGLRVDAVASMLYLDYSRKHGEWEPNIHGGRENLEAIHFLKRFNEVCYGRHPGVMTLAEESTSWPGVSRPTYLGGLGFGFKWNMGWMHDFLNYMSLEPVYRRYHQGDITFSLVYAFHEHFVLVLSHDEVVHGKGSLINKMPGDVWQKFANLRMFYAWMYAHPGKKLLFMGQEFGQWREWNHNQSLDWHLNERPEHDGLKRLLIHLNHLYKTEPALYDLDDSNDGFEWIDFHDSDNSVVAFMRKSAAGDIFVFVVNATPIPREAYRVGVQGEGFYEEMLNTDAGTYGGANIGNMGGQHADGLAWQGKSHSLLLRLPPLSVVGLKRRPYEKTFKEIEEKTLPAADGEVLSKSLSPMTSSLKSTKGFTLIELLVVIAIIAILAALAVPSITGALVKGQMVQTVNNARQIYLASFQMAADYTVSQDPNLGWPGDLAKSDKEPVTTLNGFVKRMEDYDYIKSGDIGKVFSAPGVIAYTGSGAFSADRNSAFKIYKVTEGDVSSCIFAATKNFTFGKGLDASKVPYKDKGCVIMRKGGDGLSLGKKQAETSMTSGIAGLMPGSTSNESPGTEGGNVLE